MTILLRNGMNAYLCSALTMMATIAFSCFFLYECREALCISQ